MNATHSKIVRGWDGKCSVPRKYVFEIWKKNLRNPHHHPWSTQPPSHKSHQHLTLTEENKRQASLLPAMFGREGISYFREITQLIQINPITLSLYDPTAKTQWKTPLFESGLTGSNWFTSTFLEVFDLIRNPMIFGHHLEKWPSAVYP